MQNKGFLAVIGIIIAATIGLVIFAGRSDAPAPTSHNAADITSTDHVRGNNQSAVTLIEYGDFQCPACAAYDPVMEQLFTTYGDRVRFVYRHFPLTQIHPNAMIGHRAAEAAGRQGKFFEMGHLLYERRTLWVEVSDPAKAVEAFATELGLDMDKYRADFNDPGVLSVINDQSRGGESFQINSTPTFILNGQKIDGPRSLQDFEHVLDQKLTETKTG